MSDSPVSAPLAENASRCPRYSVVVPCYNEQDSILPLIGEIAAVTRGAPEFEMIIVDDCSSDETKTRLVAAKDDFGPALRVVSHTMNCGQSAAICTGIDLARGEWIVTLDGDGQNDPADIPRLIEALEGSLKQSGTPIICGHRTTRRDSWVRKLSSRTANAVRQALLKDVTPDTGCGLKVVSRAAFMRLPRFDHMHRFLPALIQRDGGTVVSIAVGHRPRQAGQSKYGIHNRLWVGITDLIGVMWLRRRRFKSTNYEEH